MTDRSIPSAQTTPTPLQDQLHDYKINKPLRGGSRLSGGNWPTRVGEGGPEVALVEADQ